MAPSLGHEITQLLRAWTAGDEQALEKLTPLVYQQLHRVAQRCMAGERRGHTLQATALVNEVYLRLVDCEQISWQDRAHFLAVSARLMRRILIDFARSRGYQKEAVAYLMCPSTKRHRCVENRIPTSWPSMMR